MMKSRTRRSLVAASAMLATSFALGCDAPTIPDGEIGTVSARVFVDVDGNGVWNSGDQGVASATVELLRAGGESVATTTTDQVGRALFPGMRPDGYTLRYDGAGPTGAVLAGSRATSVALPAQGGEVSADFRFVYEPGTVTGRVYRDDDADGAYAAETDLAIAGATVTLSGSDGSEISEVVTGADGVYAFATLRPGEYSLDFDVPPPLEIVGESTRDLVVGPASASTLDVLVEGQLVAPIADVRGFDLGTVVAVEATVLVRQGAWGSRSVHVQDGTAGINVFLASSDSGLGLVPGDRVRLVGELGQFNDELQISQPTVTLLGTAEVPDPISITGAQMLSRDFEGSLAQLGLVTVEQVDVFSFDTHNVTASTPDGRTVVIRVDSRTGIASADWTVGEQYRVTGVLRSFRGTPQLYPRDPADQVFLDLATPIATARTLELGTEVDVEGIVTVDQGAWGSRSIQIEDATGGINVFLASSDSGLGLEIGDRVRLVGELGQFNDELQVSQPTVTLLGADTPRAPRAITGSQMLARTQEGRLAVLDGFTVTAVDVFSFDTHNVTGTTPDGSTVVLRVDSRTGIGSADWTVGETYRVTGVLRSFRGTPQLYPRQPSDREQPAPSTSIADARGVASGTEVTITGVVTADQGIFDFRSRDTYVQDATGGIRLWNLDDELGLRAGERVRVTGTVSAFNDEIQLTVTAISREGNLVVPDPRPVTADEINAFEYQGQLVVTGEVTVEAVDGFSFDAHNVTVRNDAGATFVLRMESPNEIPTDYWQIGERVVVTGIASRFRSTAQIKLRGFADVEER